MWTTAINMKILNVMQICDSNFPVGSFNHSFGMETYLRDGDILFNDGHNMVVISVKEDDVIVITPRDINEMGEVAHNLGNKHLPVQIEDGKIIIQYDYLVEKFLQDLQVNFERKNMKLKQAFRHVDHSH